MALAADHVYGSTASGMMRILTSIGLLFGLAAVTVMVAWQGIDTIGAVVISLGAGLLLLPLAFLPHLALAAMSWILLFRPGRAPRFADTLRAMWMGLSVDVLLPLASLGGEVVKLRVLLRAGVGGTDAGASVVVDKTVQAISLILWGLFGIAILVWFEADQELVAGALLASALLAAGVGGFIFVQYAGTFGFLAKILGKAGNGDPTGRVVDGAVDLDNTLRALYRRPGRIASASTVRLLSRVALTLEVWLAAHLMGIPITLWEALMLKSLTGALRGAAFVVPGGWGVQEGGYIVLGGLLGLSPEVMLAVSLATRARELLVSLPGLIAWQHGEGRSLWQRVRSDDRN